MGDVTSTDPAEHRLATSSEGDETLEQQRRLRALLPMLGESDQPGSLGRLDHYEIRSIVGWGGMGVVLQAFDESLGRLVAIKVLHPHLAAHGAARQRFAREARAAAAVNHPSVVPIHSVQAEHHPPYLVMAYVPGGSLQDRIDREGPLATTDVLRIGIQIADALQAAHAQGLVHRDVKPGNILLDHGQNRVLLTDFGLAQALDDATLTASGALAGTPQYMSPEQARGESVDHRSDLFSLGGVLYAMATGRPPFRGPSTLAVLHKIGTVDAKPISEIVPETPEWLDQLLSQLHAKAVTDRPDSAAKVGEWLRACLAHARRPRESALPTALAPAKPSHQPTLLPPSKPKSDRVPHSLPRRMARAVVAVTCLGIIGGLAILFESGLRSTREPAPVPTLLAPPAFEPLPPDVTAWDDGLDVPLAEIDDYLGAID